MAAENFNRQPLWLKFFWGVRSSVEASADNISRCDIFQFNGYI